MSAQTRNDIYNLAADIAIETAINSMLAVDTGHGTDSAVNAKNITRKEALRFLAKRVMLKDRFNKTRLVAANTPGVAQS